MTRGCGFSGGAEFGEVFLPEHFVLAELYVQFCTYKQMKRRTRVTKARATKARRTTRRKTITLMPSVEEPKNAHVMIEQVQRMYKARKKAVMLRLDADGLAWFRTEGRGVPDEDQSGAAGSDVGRGEKIVEVRSGAFLGSVAASPGSSLSGRTAPLKPKARRPPANRACPFADTPRRNRTAQTASHSLFVHENGTT